MAGAVVPTPDGCQPAKNWENVEDQLGKGDELAHHRQPPAEDPRLPMRTTTAATSQVVSLVLALTRPRPE